VQDSVTIVAAPRRGRHSGRRDRHGGVEIGERVILAHGATVKGPARIGVGGSDVAGNADGKPEVFVSFGAEIDGAILEQNTQVSALGRVGPGVRLRSGRVVLAGKDVDSQREADDPSLGKVRDITPADIAFAEAVIEVNTLLAREDSRLARQGRSNVRGINFDPGNTAFNPDRDLPMTRSHGVEPGTEPHGCVDGTPTRQPRFRNRIIGEVCLADPPSRLDDVMGSEISLRADEGEPLGFGKIRRMMSGVISHALEESTVEVGDNVYYGRDSIVHGGGRRQDGGGRGTESTVVEDDVTLGSRSITFRSLVGKGSTIGVKSAVVSSELAAGTRIPDRVIYLNNAVVGRVEW
jgi:carbonic anhydrase/acetyltransferase-like protein (isoleucine patch superfamily)